MTRRSSVHSSKIGAYHLDRINGCKKAVEGVPWIVSSALNIHRLNVTDTCAGVANAISDQARH
jgi:hypothetical protein